MEAAGCRVGGPWGGSHKEEGARSGTHRCCASPEVAAGDCHLRTPVRCDPSSTPRAGRTRRPGAHRRGAGGSLGPGVPPGRPRPCPTPQRGCRRVGDPCAAAPAGPRPAAGTLGMGNRAVGGARDPRGGAGGARGVTTHLWPPRRSRPRPPGPAPPRRARSTRSHLGPAGRAPGGTGPPLSPLQPPGP